MSQEGTLQQFLDALKSVDAFKLKIFKANTPADLSAAQAGLARITHEIQQRFPQFNNDLTSTFRASFIAAGGVGVPPKNFVAKSLASRKKAEAGFGRATTGLRQWGTDFGNDRTVIKARQAYDDKIAKMKRTGATDEEVQSQIDLRNKLPSKIGASDTPTVFYHRKKPNADGIDRIEVPADTYMKMAANAAYATQRNLGVAAAAAQGSGYVIVVDGPNCGRSRHKDGTAVNGEVWDVDTALRYPIAHPNCQRSFMVSPGPPTGKKTKDMLKELGLAPQRSKVFKTVEAIAEAAATAGVVASVGQTIIQNPFIQRYIRELIADSNIKLAPAAEQLLNRLQSYAGREAKAFADHGAELGAATQQEFDTRVLNSFDNDLANRNFLEKAGNETVQISQPQAKVLGLSTKPSKAELMTRLDDYGDYLVHKESLAKSIDERIQAAANMSNAKDEIYRTAALKFHLEPGEGINAQRNWYNIINKLKETYDRNPDKADRDLIRLVAGVVDPTPWLKVALTDNVKFTLGLTSRGRQELAVKIFDNIRASRALNDVEIKWAEELGMDLHKFAEPVSINKKDVINALTPRITYQPGGLFSSTLALKGGKLQPIIRLYPDGTLGRLTSLEAKLRTGAVEDFITAIRKHDLPIGERWIEALSNVAQEDLITSLRLFRNSPLQVSLRMVGAGPDSFAIRALPDNDFIRYSYRFTLDSGQRSLLETEIRSRLLGGEDVQSILDSIIKAQGPVADAADQIARQKAARILVRKEAASIARANMDQWLEGVTVLPNLGGGFNLSGISLSQREAIIKLKLLGNSLLTIGKQTRYGYDQLLEMWAEFRTTVQDFMATVGDKRLASIRSFKDATELLGDTLRKRTSLVDAVSGEDLTKVDLSFADKASKEVPALRRDLAKFRLAWESQFPGIPVPLVEVIEDLVNPLNAKAGVIQIRGDIARDWEMLGNLRRKAVRIGHFPRDTESTVANLIHEGAHSIMLQMPDFEIRKLMQAAIRAGGQWGVKSLDFADLPFMRQWFGKEYFRKKVARSVSGYAATNIDELLAEALSEFFTSGNPRPIAQAVGEAFKGALANPGEAVNFSRAKYSWEGQSKSALVDTYKKESKKWIDTVTKLAQERENGPLVPLHKPTWWWRDNAPAGLEDLEFDKAFQAEPRIVDDIYAGIGKVQERFPNIKLPRISLMKTYQSGEQIDYAFAAYNSGDKMMYIPEPVVLHYDAAAEYQALASDVGWSATSGSFDQTIVHEMGHHVAYTLNNDQVDEVFQFLSTSPLLSADMRAAIDDTVMPILEEYRKDTSMTAAEKLDEKWLLFDEMIQNDAAHVVTSVSEYGTTNAQEFFAETFAKGIYNPLSDAGKFVSLLAKLLR